MAIDRKDPKWLEMKQALREEFDEFLQEKEEERKKKEEEKPKKSSFLDDLLG